LGSEFKNVDIKIFTIRLNAATAYRKRRQDSSVGETLRVTSRAQIFLFITPSSHFDVHPFCTGDKAAEAPGWPHNSFSGEADNMRSLTAMN
jgi:hypothetical protein